MMLTDMRFYDPDRLGYVVYLLRLGLQTAPTVPTEHRQWLEDWCDSAEQKIAST